MKSMKPNIVIAEPYPLIFEGLFHILSNTESPFSIHRAINFNEIHHIHHQTPIDIVLMNPILVQNNIEQFTKLKTSMEQTNWLGIICAYFPPTILSLFSGQIQLSDQPNFILETIHKHIETDHHQETGEHQFLTEREIDVLKLLVTGNSNKEIADKLFISAHTVISHRKNISAKTGIKSLSGLTIYAVIKNIISIENF
jgi:DNA-binding NarL/FixJ family response regulator